jgi:hypothetical protein
MEEVFNNATNEFIQDFHTWYHKKQLHTFIPWDKLTVTPLYVTQGMYNSFLLTQGIIILYTARGASVVHTAYKNKGDLNDEYLIKIPNESTPLKNYKKAMLEIVKDYPKSIMPF